MLQSWKIPEMVKGGLTWLPGINRWRHQRAATGGSDSARYCYAVWFRHLAMLVRHGFCIHEAQVGELGPGDSIGTGLVALLSGAARYSGLDVMPFSAHANLPQLFVEVASLYERREPIPDHTEFPRVRPRLANYEFPGAHVEWPAPADKIAQIQARLRDGIRGSGLVTYHAPWTSAEALVPGSLDLLFSQSVLQYIDALEETYRATFLCLKPGGYASHSIGLWAHQFSPYWNGHWAYADWQWRLVRGRRELLINRQPLGMHMYYATKVGFDILWSEREYASDGLPVTSLMKQYQALDAEDLKTRGAMLILRKPN